jgi:hypothetical protein
LPDRQIGTAAQAGKVSKSAIAPIGQLNKASADVAENYSIVIFV